MKLLSKGPNMVMIYHYMKCKGYLANFDSNSGKRMVIFTKTLHHPDFPKLPCLKGLVVVHKIEIDVTMGAVHKHWLENRGLGINGWDYLRFLEELQEQSIKVYNATKEWMRKGWIMEAYKELTKTKKKGTK